MTIHYTYRLTSLPGELTQSRGIGSTLWGWITYPFSWWSSKEDEPAPITDQLIASTTFGPYDNNIDIGKHNVSVWCNDQTCTTMKCNKNGCKNNTCNIYDTDLMGICREYNTVIDPEEPVQSQPTSTARPQNNVPQTTSLVPDQTKAPEVNLIPIATTDSYNEEVEHPLELEEMLSSTVAENKTPNKL